MKLVYSAAPVMIFLQNAVVLQQLYIWIEALCLSTEPVQKLSTQIYLFVHLTLCPVVPKRASHYKFH